MTAKKTKKSEEARIKARAERDDRMRRHANHTTIVLGLSMAALILSLVAMVIGPWVVKEMQFQYNRAAVIKLEAADKMLEHSKAEVIREKTIADKFALDRENEKKNAEEFEAQHDKTYAINKKRAAKIHDTNRVYIEAVYSNLRTWAKKHKRKGIYSCELDRDASHLIDPYQWEKCIIYRDFNPPIKIMCSNTKCGGAKLLK